MKQHSQFCEFIAAKSHSKRKGQLQVVVFYKYPKCSQTELKKDISSVLKPLVDPDGRLVIMGDFNVLVNEAPKWGFHNFDAPPTLKLRE